MSKPWGGEISFKSDPENGTTFWLTFDEKAAEQLHLTSENAHVLPRPAAREANITGTVLYIEDNLVNLNLVQEIISDFTQLKFISAPDAEIGIEMARKYQPDIIVMDINLPGMNGIAALEKLQSDDLTSHIRVIALSASAMPREVEAAKEAGFNDYLTKPLDIDLLLDAVSRSNFN